MKLFTRDIDKKLFAQYQKGASLENQVVVAKIFNPYGAGRWYLLNSDPSEPDYLWAIVQINGEPETGSVSRKGLENIRVKPFNLPLERDLYFSPINALELYKGLLRGKIYKAGGMTEASENKEMLLNQAEGFEHHAEEFESAVKKSDHIPAWVVAKSERASTDLSDITHYLDGENEQREEMTEGEEEYADGGELNDTAAKQSFNKGVIDVMAEDFVKKLKTKGINATKKSSKNGVFVYGEKRENGKYKYETYISYSELPNYEFLEFEESEFLRLHKKMAMGGRLDVGRYYKTTDGRQVRYLGDTKDPEVGTFTSKADGVLKVRYDEIEGKASLFEDGGEMADGGIIKPEKPIEKMTKLELMRFVSKIDMNKNFYPKTTLAGRVQAKNIYNEYLERKNSKMAMGYPKFEKGGYMAKGGFIEHGLKTGDKIISGKIIGTTIIVRNENHDEHAKVDLNTGERTILFYDKKTKKWIPKMAMGGKVKFADKVKSIKSSLLERKKVSPKVQKDYGKTYSPKEAEESAKRIVGAMTAKERLMAKRKKSKK